MPLAGCRFAHAAGVSLDATLRDVGPVPKDLRSTVRDATLAAFETLITTCLERDVDFLLLAGGTFDARDTSSRGRSAFRDGIECLDESGITTVIVPGAGNGNGTGNGGKNGGDPPGFWSSFERLPASVKIVDPFSEEPITVARQGAIVARIHTARSRAWDPHQRFDTSHADPRPVEVLVAETATDGPFDYTALTSAGPRSSNGREPVLHRCGPLQPVRPGQPEGAFTLVNVDAARDRVELETVGADMVRWLTIPPEENAWFRENRDIAALADDMVAHLQPMIADHVALTLVTWVVDAGVRLEDALRERLERACDERWGHRGPGRLLHRWEWRLTDHETADDPFERELLDRIRDASLDVETLLADVASPDLYERLGRDLDREAIAGRAGQRAANWLHEEALGGAAT